MKVRRIQKVGRNTLVVSLPYDWAEKVDLKKGDLVIFEELRDGSLNLRPYKNKTEQICEECVINSDLCNEPGLLERIIVSNYIMGRDTIKIISSRRIRREHLSEIRGIVQKLLGLSIMEESDKRVLLRCSLNITAFPVHLLLGRLYVIASTMHKECMQALIEFNADLAEAVIMREEEADKIYWLTLRALLSAQMYREVALKVGLEDVRRILGNRVIAHHLERIADWCEIIARNALGIIKNDFRLKPELLQKIQRFNELCFETHYKAMQALYKCDVKGASNVVKLYKNEIEGKEETLTKEAIENAPTAACPFLRAILFGIRRIAELGAEIAEIAMNRALEESSEICKVNHVCFTD